MKAKIIRRKKIKFGQILLILLLGALVCFTGLPLVAMVCRALMSTEELYIYPPRIIS